MVSMEADVVKCPHCREYMPTKALLCVRCGHGTWGGWYAEEGVLEGVAYSVRGLNIEGVTLPSGSGKTSLVVFVPREYHGDDVSMQNPRPSAWGGASEHSEQILRMKVNGRSLMGAMFSLGYEDLIPAMNRRFLSLYDRHTNLVVYRDDVLVVDWTVDRKAWRDADFWDDVG